MASGFGALGDQDIGASIGGAQRFANFAGRYTSLCSQHHGHAGNSHLKVLFLARPGEGSDRRVCAQRDREHVLLDLKQKMINAEGLACALMYGGNLVL